MKNIKVSEIFPSIQGEGRFVGMPMLFVRLSGCTRACVFCDTSYHTEGKEVDVNYLEERIKDYKGTNICFTGGEPLLQREVLREVITKCKEKSFHLETNGDLLIENDFQYFDYICISPKDIEVAKKVFTLRQNNFSLDIKVVTDLKNINRNLVEYATFLMPLSVESCEEDKKIQQEVWNYCIEKNIKYSSRLQVSIWGVKKRRK